MALRIIMAVGMLPVLPILFGAYWFLAGEKHGTQFGVALWEGAREQPQVQEIKRLYKRELKLYALACLLAFFLTLLPEHESLLITGTVVWVFSIIVFLLLPFRRANKRMREQKREYLASLPTDAGTESREEILIDVTAAGAPKLKSPRKPIYAGCAFALLAPIAELFLYHAWYRPWLPELLAVEFTLLATACAACCFLAYVRFFDKQRVNVFTYNSQVNLQVAGIRRYHLGRFCTGMAWLTGAFNWGLLLTFHLPPRWFPWLVAAISFLFGSASMAGMFCCWKKIGKGSQKYLAGEPLVEEDNDKYWIWGMVYYNKNDSRSFVETRAGLGITANMAKPAMKYTTIIVLLVIFFIMAWTCGWCILEEFTPISLSYENGMLTSKHWKKEYQIPEADMEQVILQEELPKISRKSGTSMDNLAKGSYYCETGQRDFKVCLNPKEPPFLMVECTDGSWYLLGGRDGEETRQVYAHLRKAGNAGAGRDGKERKQAYESLY